MMRLAEDLIYFAIETKMEDRGTFVKLIFKPDFEQKIEELWKERNELKEVGR